MSITEASRDSVSSSNSDILLFFVLTSSSFSYQRCTKLNNNLAKSECLKSNNRSKEALENLNKFQKSLINLESIQDFIDFKKIRLLTKSSDIIISLDKFKLKYPESNLIKKIELIKAEALLNENLNKSLMETLGKIIKKYKLSAKDRLIIKYLKGSSLYRTQEYNKSFKAIKQLAINNPQFKAKKVNELLYKLKNNHSYFLSKDERITRLHNLYGKNMYSIFMKEYDDKLSVLLRIKKALIMVKSKDSEKGLKILKKIAAGGFTDSGSQSTNLEAIAESKYRIILLKLKSSDNNSLLAKELQSILSNYPNFSKNNAVGYLSARLFTIDKEYEQGIKVYNWLIKTKSKGYIDKSFYGLGFSEYMLGNYKEAIGYFRSLKESDESYYRQLGSFWTGKSLLKLGDKTLALKEYKDLANKYKIGYYSYLASTKINIKTSKNIFKKIQSNNYIGDITLLRYANQYSPLRKEVENYIRNKINTSNYNSYLSALDDAGEFNLSIKISYNYNSDNYYKYPRGYKSIVNKYSKKYDVDSNLIFALIREESLFNPLAKSWVGAKGLMQLMDKTADSLDKELNIKSNLLNPDDNINLGTYYLMKLMNRFDNNIPSVLAAYNGGPNNVELWRKRFAGVDDDEFVENIPFKETHGYVKRLLRSYHYYKNNY